MPGGWPGADWRSWAEQVALRLRRVGEDLPGVQSCHSSEVPCVSRMV